MRWLIARYQPTSLFSLKHGDATSTGGKSLLVPTPFAIRMALLDVAIRVDGVDAGAQAFEHLKSLRLAVRLPAHVAVASIFVKVLKPDRNAEKTGRAMLQTIAFREYVHLAGELTLALHAVDQTLAVVTPWLMQVNYFGKRGSFYQLVEPPQIANTEETALPADFIELNGPNMTQEAPMRAFPLGMIQRLDDWGAALSFAKADIYNREAKSKINLGDDRVRLDVVLPYRLVSSSRGYTLYERFDP